MFITVCLSLYLFVVCFKTLGKTYLAQVSKIYHAIFFTVHQWMNEIVRHNFCDKIFHGTTLLLLLLKLLLLTVLFALMLLFQWRHRGGGAQSEALPPNLSPSEEKNGQNQPFSAYFWIFAPSMPPTKKKKKKKKKNLVPPLCFFIYLLRNKQTKPKSKTKTCVSNSYQDIFSHISSTNSMSLLQDNIFYNQDTVAFQNFCHNIGESGDRTVYCNPAIETDEALGSSPINAEKKIENGNYNFDSD